MLFFCYQVINLQINSRILQQQNTDQNPKRNEGNQQNFDQIIQHIVSQRTGSEIQISKLGHRSNKFSQKQKKSERRLLSGKFRSDQGILSNQFNQNFQSYPENAGSAFNRDENYQRYQSPSNFNGFSGFLNQYTFQSPPNNYFKRPSSGFSTVYPPQYIYSPQTLQQSSNYFLPSNTIGISANSIVYTNQDDHQGLDAVYKPTSSQGDNYKFPISNPSIYNYDLSKSSFNPYLRSNNNFHQKQAKKKNKKRHHKNYNFNNFNNQIPSIQNNLTPHHINDPAYNFNQQAQNQFSYDNGIPLRHNVRISMDKRQPLKSLTESDKDIKDDKKSENENSNLKKQDEKGDIKKT